MKKYKLNISVRYNTQDRRIDSVELDTLHFEEFLRIRELSVFNPESWLTFSLEELPEPEPEVEE